MITKSINLPEGYTLNTEGWTAGEGEWTLSVNEGKGLLTYKDGQLTYTLQDNYAHADATDDNEGLSGKPTFDLKLTHDATGVEVSTTVTVDVLDDAPEITVNSDPSNTLGWTGGASGHYTTESGSLTLKTGADGLKEDSLKVTDGAGKSATFDAEGSAIISYEDGSKLEAEYNAETGEISYTYTPGAGTETTDRSFTFSAQDNDDDPTSATVNVKVDLADSGDVSVEGQSITVDESGLADGTTPDSGMITKPITLPEGYTLNTDGWSDGGDGALTYSVNDGKGLLTYKDGKLTYTLQDNYDHDNPEQDNEGLADGRKPTFDLNLTHDATGVEVSTTVTVDVLDDAPTISSVDADNDGKPDITFERYPDVDSEDTPLGDGTTADFTKYNESTPLNSVSNSIWNGEVTISGGRVKYTYSNEDERIVDTIEIISEEKGISYSSHVTNGNIGNSVEERKDSMGLTVAGEAEISADSSYGDEGICTGVANQSDAIIVTLPEGTVAYGLNLKLGAFFTESSSTEGTKWDTVAEQALLTFYKDGEVVLIYHVTANSADGSYTVPADLVITEGFDKVVISAVDNSWASKDNYRLEQSDFVVQEIGFVTLPPNEVMFRYEGDLVSDGGADGFADGYRFAFSDKMGESMQVTLGDGKTVKATLTITEGDNGSSILLATIPGADGKPENLFSVTLDADGHWKFDQYQEFSKPDGSDFELGFMTKDSDGDTAYEEVTLITTTETNLGTSGDHAPTSIADVIVNGNSGHDNFVGDPGGATESTQTTYTDLNVALVVDTSSSMAGTRMSETKEALEGLCEQLKEHADKGADVNLSLIGFSGALNINLPVEDITGIEENYRKFTLRDGDTIIGKVGTEFSVPNNYFSSTTYRITEDGTLQRWESGFIDWGGSWKDVRTFSTENLTGYEAVLAQIDAMEANGSTNYSAGYGAAKDWFGGKNDPNSLQNNGGENIVIFVTDGEPNEGNTQGSYKQLVGAVDDITVETIGIAITGDQATGLLNGLTTNNKGAHFIGEADQLGDVFGKIVSDITTSTVTPAADDVILGGRGNDMLFGDALNADYLLGDGYTWEGKEKYTQGSSWDIINAYLFATFGHNPSEGEIAKFIAQNADKLGLTDSITDDTGSVRGGNDTLLGGSGDDIVYGQGGDDLLFGDGSDTATSGTSIETLNALDTLLTDAGAEAGDSYAERIRNLGTSETPDQPSELDRFIDSLEGTGGIEKDTDGNDRLFGGAGDDMLFGGAGDDFIDGGEGRDTIFGGSGNDIIVYDSNDYLVSGGSGIDFMVSDDTTLTLSSLLGNSGSDKPLVSGIEVLLKGKDALSLTSLEQLAKDYGITLDTNAEGKETLTLDMDKWTYDSTNDVYTSKDGGLTLETNLTPVDASDPASEAVQQQVFTLEHGNG